MQHKSYSGSNSQSELEYGDDDEELLYKYVEMKNQRKKAEEDAQLIQNRINLLLQEERKAHKQIEETKKKAQEIMEHKLRLHQIKAQNNSEQLDKLRDQQIKVELTKARREQIAEERQVIKVKNQMKKMQEVNRFKEALLEKKIEKENRENEERRRNLKNARIIKDQEKKQKILKEVRKKEREILSRISHSAKNSQYYPYENNGDSIGKFESVLLRRLQNGESFEFDYRGNEE